MTRAVPHEMTHEMIHATTHAKAHTPARLLAAAFAAAIIYSPSLAQACSVCTAGRDEENQLAFLLSTIGMSLMPLIAIGTLVFVLWRRIKKLEAASAGVAESPSV
jgi:formate/nitrite transporter FocA (FNT family)